MKERFAVTICSRNRTAARRLLRRRGDADARGSERHVRRSHPPRVGVRRRPALFVGPDHEGIAVFAAEDAWAFEVWQLTLDCQPGVTDGRLSVRMPTTADVVVVLTRSGIALDRQRGLRDRATFEATQLCAGPAAPSGGPGGG
jgi:hypothetical protein